jgi:hypothetical protein
VGVESFTKEDLGESVLNKDRKELYKTSELVTDIRRKMSHWLGNVIIVEQEREVRRIVKVRCTVKEK